MARQRFLRVPGVRGLLLAGDAPAILTPAMLAGIRRQAFEEAAPKARAAFAIGQEVRIEDGPFTGFFARVTALDPHGRVELLLSLFARPTRVTLDGRQVAA